RRAQWWPLGECAMRPVVVVVRHIRREDMLEMAAAEDEEPVKTLSADAANPALGVRPRLRRPHRCPDHADPFGAEDLVELAGQLAVSIRDEEPGADILVVEPHQEVARLLGHPPPFWIRRDTCQPDTASGKLNEEQDVGPLQEQGVDGEEVALKDARS